MRLVVLTDAEDRPIRLELVDFLGRDGAARQQWPLAGGLYAPAFTTAKLEDAMQAMVGATFGEPVAVDTTVHPKQRAVVGNSPAGHRFELWEQPA